MDGSTAGSGAKALPRAMTAFEGRWSVAREILQASGQRGHFEGEATLGPIGPGRLAYREEGTLRLDGGTPFFATRSYIWRDAKGAVEVSFDDGRPFHSFPLACPTHETVHLCPPDRYQVAYDFSQWPVWETEWQVEGPRKAYRMRTVFRRPE
ncbi:MAG: DUF6314 family protein [Pseudomonadota bacterium]